MDDFESFKKYLRTDIPGIFNEIFILKKHLDRFNYALDTDIVLPPYEVIIHPCSRCNLRCKWCIGGNVPTEKGETKADLQRLPSTLTDPSKMERLIKNLLSYKKTVTTTEDNKKIKKTYRVENVSFSGLVGEPFVAKESFIRAVELLTKQNIRVGVYSNGTLLDDELIEALLKIAYINIDVDAGRASTYSKSKYRADNKEGKHCSTG
jgi:MoaA/NifB/PqqE/SkfB family radical SAM enzyme